MGLTLPEDYRDFKGSRAGETAWVIGSGASIDHIAPGFFDDKLCVCVNYVGQTLALPEFYSVTHYWLDALALAEYRPDLPIITPDTDQGGRNLASHAPSGPNVYLTPSGAQQYAAFLRGLRAPGRKCGIGRGNGTSCFRFAHVGHRANRQASGRIHDSKRFARICGYPCPIDETAFTEQLWVL